jgi:hypothetical protein
MPQNLESRYAYLTCANTSEGNVEVFAENTNGKQSTFQ